MEKKDKENVQRLPIRFHLRYYISTLRISILVAIIILAIFTTQDAPLERRIYAMLLSYPTLGLGLDFLYKWMIRRDEFFFYHNAGCSIIELLVTSFVIAASVSTLLFQIVKIWM